MDTADATVLSTGKTNSGADVKSNANSKTRIAVMVDARLCKTMMVSLKREPPQGVVHLTDLEKVSAMTRAMIKAIDDLCSNVIRLCITFQTI